MYAGQENHIKTVERQILEEKLRNLKLANQLLELKIIAFNRTPVETK